MKNPLLTFGITLLITFSGFSQTIPPPYINYQAILYDVNGTNANAPYALQSFPAYVNIKDELGNLLYREEHYSSTDGNGQVNLKIGDGLYLAGPISNFNQIPWQIGKYYLVVEFEINGAISATAPEQLVTVPYAFYSGNSGSGISTVTDNGNGTLTFTYNNGSTYTSPVLSGLTGLTGPAGATGPQGPAGVAGPQGTAGTNGLNALIKTTAEVAGANCSSGGTKIETGLDANSNGVLDVSEVNVSQTRYVCNGSGATFQSGNVQGEMLFWNGSAWTTIPPGQTGQNLTFCYNAPQWGPCLAQIVTLNVSNITGYLATSGITISNNGGNQITSAGICWGTSPNPTIANNINTNANLSGTTSLDLTNLSPGTVYYLRAFATNSAGTIYGNEQVFTSGANIPTVLTETATNITYNSATITGNVTNDGGATVTQRGICYSTSPNPTVLNSFVNSGTGTGNFTANLTSLSGSTTYYARAFATNSSGTAYGSELTINTGFSPSPIQCSGATNMAYPIETNPQLNGNGWLTVNVNQQITISQQTTAPFIVCGYGNVSQFTNPPQATVVSGCCSNGCVNPNQSSKWISEVIYFTTPGVYNVQVQCGNISYSYCTVSIEVLP